MILDYGSFEYEIGYDEIEEFLKSKTKNQLIEIILDCADLEDFKEEIAEYFAEEAFENQRDLKDFEQDPYSYNGVKESDF